LFLLEKEKKPLSRIHRGGSAAVKNVRLEPKKAEAVSFGPPQFRRHVSEDFITLDEAQALVQQAASEGKAEGVREAEARLKKPVQEGLAKIEAVLAELASFRAEILKEAEMDVVELLRRISQKVLSAESKLQPEVLSKIVEKALLGLGQEKRIVISFNPSDQVFFEKMSSDFLKELKTKSELEFKPEAQVATGTAWIRTESVEIEINTDKMVDEILKDILQSVKAPKETGDEGDKV